MLLQGKRTNNHCAGFEKDWLINVQIVLLGVCWSSGNSTDPLNELSVVPLPGYSISSDNVTMCSTACTPEGRIFLGGGDGHLYEVLYNTSSGWRQRQCTKARHLDLIMVMSVVCTGHKQSCGARASSRIIPSSLLLAFTTSVWR